MKKQTIHSNSACEDKTNYVHVGEPVNSKEIKYSMTTNNTQWQICPLCGGTGKVWSWFLTSAHPIPPTFSHDGSMVDCPVCHGKRIINTDN
jgi:hypothetical protein